MTFIGRTSRLTAALAVAGSLLATPAMSAIDDELVIGKGNWAGCPDSGGSPLWPSIDEHCDRGSTPTTLTTYARFPYSGFVVHNWDENGDQVENGFSITGNSDSGTGVLGLTRSGGGSGVAARNDSTGAGLDASSKHGVSVHAAQGNASTTVLAENTGSDWGNGGDAVRGWSKQQDGVEGDSSAAGGSGVFGFNDGGGYGIFGRTTKGTKAAIGAQNDGSGDGVAGRAATNGGAGVRGDAAGTRSPGVYGENVSGGDGVRGYSRQQDGVEGDSSAPGASGVYGFNDGNGTGATGRATGSGTGVSAIADTAAGTALKVSGKVTFSRSGVLTLTSGTTVTKAAIDLSATSMVLATLQTNVAGLSVQSAVPNVAGKSITITLSKPVTAVTRVAFMVVG